VDPSAGHSIVIVTCSRLRPRVSVSR
jgi:hypothetical protein